MDIPSFCCYKECDTCQDAPSNSTRNNSLLNTWNSIDPITCSSNKYLSTDGSSLCKDSYHCYYESSYQVCSNSRSSSSSSSSCKTQCDCTLWVWDVRCKIICPFCYTVVIEVKYDISQGIEISNVMNFFEQDKDTSEIYMKGYSLTIPVKCFYNPKNLLNVFFDVNYIVKIWAIVGLVTFLFYLSLVVISARLSAEYLSDIPNHWINFFVCFWFGTIPSIIFISVLHSPGVNTKA
ncbi:10572_t:CDS:1, partial [Scutellospora calospora]